MIFTTTCPNCKKSHSYDETQVGQAFQCDRCGKELTFYPDSRVMTPGEESEFADFSASQPDHEIPSTLGRYKILKEIGHGAMGIVYLAEDPKLNNRRVALKVPLKDYKRFHREASVAAQFHHPNFCPIYDVGEDNCVPFLVMAFIEGRSLEKRIVRDQPWEARKAAKLVRILAQALAAAHKEKVIHRDLKPANIMIDLKGQVFLMDFGLARGVSAGGPLSTADGTVLGTAAYMPPEQAKGRVKEIDERSDIYSLGAIFYELLTGRLPFEAEISWQVLAMVVGTDPPSPSQINPKIDPGLEAVVLKAMAKKPEDRYASMTEFAGALAGFLSQEVAPSPAEGRDSQISSNIIEREPTSLRDGLSPGPRSPIGIWIATAAGFVALLFGIIYVANKEALKPVPAPPVAAKVEQPPPPTPEPKKVEPPPDIPKPREMPKAVAEAPAPPKIEDPLITNIIGMKLALIPAGEFDMGSDATDPNAEADEKVNGKKHHVRITRPFYLGTTEVTQGQYRAVTNESPSNFKGSDDLPVERVSWFDAVRFCNALSGKEGLTPFYRIVGEEVSVLDQRGTGYRLPTEAEWEYACRAGPGGTGVYGFVGEVTQFGRHAWYDANSEHKTHPVGRKDANAWGLFDMHGNVWEWCADWYDEGYYAKSPSADPLNSTQAAERVYRGGGWNSNPRSCRSAVRYGDAPVGRGDDLGFRVARVRPGS